MYKEKSRGGIAHGLEECATRVLEFGLSTDLAIGADDLPSAAVVFGFDFEGKQVNDIGPRIEGHSVCNAL